MKNLVTINGHLAGKYFIPIIIHFFYVHIYLVMQRKKAEGCVSLLALLIRPCGLQGVVLKSWPGPDWWIEKMKEDMILFLNAIPAIKESMLQSAVGGTEEQLESINLTFILIGDIYTNAGCQLPVIPTDMFYCRSQIDLLRKAHPSSTSACRSSVQTFGGLASILCRVGLASSESCVKCNLI